MTSLPSPPTTSVTAGDVTTIRSAHSLPWTVDPSALVVVRALATAGTLAQEDAALAPTISMPATTLSAATHAATRMVRRPLPCISLSDLSVPVDLRAARGQPTTRAGAGELPICAEKGPHRTNVRGSEIAQQNVGVGD